MEEKMAKSDNIKISTKNTSLNIPGRYIYLVIMLIVIFFIPRYMEVYPIYQSSVMGNTSISSGWKMVIVFTPTLLFIVFILVLIILIVSSFLSSRKNKNL